jgi:hypothetical protein
MLQVGNYRRPSSLIILIKIKIWICVLSAEKKQWVAF